MRIAIFVTLSILLIFPLLTYGQQTDGAENLQADNSVNRDGDLDIKSDDTNGDNNENKEAKPRKTTYKEERFEKLFNNRNRKPRLPAPKYHQKPKPKLPSFIKNPPSIKPLGQDGLPVDDAPRPTTPTSRAKPSSRSNVVKATTSAPRARSKASATTTQKPSLNESNKRFNLSPRGRIASTGTAGRGRIN